MINNQLYYSKWKNKLGNVEQLQKKQSIRRFIDFGYAEFMVQLDNALQRQQLQQALQQPRTQKPNLD